MVDRTGQDAAMPLDRGISLAQKFMIYCAVALIVVGTFTIGTAAYLATRIGGNLELFFELNSQGNSPFLSFVAANMDAVVLLLAGVFAVILGSNMMRRAISATAKTISDADRALLEPLIKDGNSKALAEYVRLSSLTGVTGVFTKLGFTGLPLATASLGIFLILLATFETKPETASELMDLAKLVLGAFIGSFVQRKVERPDSDVAQEAGDSRPLP